MHLKEFSKPLTSKRLNESLAQRFGEKINLNAFTTEQLCDVRNKIRTKLSQVTTKESYNAVQKEDYAKNKLFLDVLNAAIAERDDNIIDALDEAFSRTDEGAEDSAELVMAAKDMVDRVTGWMEDTAEMQTESMLELADAIRDEMGSEMAEQFTSSIKPALEQLYASMESTRQTLTQGVGMLTGETEPATPMGSDDDMDMEPTTDMETGDGTGTDDTAMDDEFGASEPAAGGQEETGREKRESIYRSKKKLR